MSVYCLGKKFPKPVRRANGLDDEDNNCIRHLFAANSCHKNVNNCSDDLNCTMGRVTTGYSSNCHQINKENSCNMQYYVPAENTIESDNVVLQHPSENAPNQHSILLGSDIMPNHFKNLESKCETLDDVNRSKSAPQLESNTRFPSTTVQSQVHENSFKEQSNQLQMQSSIGPAIKFDEMPVNQSPNYNYAGHTFQNQSIPNQYTYDMPREMRMNPKSHSHILPQDYMLPNQYHTHQAYPQRGMNNCPHHGGSYTKATSHQNPPRILNIPDLPQYSPENIIPDINNPGMFPGFFNNCPSGRNHYVLQCSKDLQILDEDNTQLNNGN